MLLINNQLIGEGKFFKRNFLQCDEWVFLVMNSRKIEFSSEMAILYPSQFVWPAILIQRGENATVEVVACSMNFCQGC